MPHKFKFAEGEKVLCFYEQLIYEAKCLKTSISEQKEIKYFIHYAGWNKSWDEWVPESKVLKYNRTNVRRQKEAQRAHDALPSKCKKSKRRKTDAVEDADSRACTPNQEVGMDAKTKQPSTPSDSQDSSSDVPRLEPFVVLEKLFLNKEAGLEVSKGVKPKEPSTPSSSQDSSSDVPRLEPFVVLEKLFLNKEAELEVNKGVKPKEPSTPSSSQDSSSDVPRLEPFVVLEKLFLNKEAGLEPSTPSSSQDSSSDVSCLESSFEFGELFFNKEAGLEPRTPSSSQDSSSDVSCLESSFEFGELFFNKEAGLEPSTPPSSQDSSSDVSCLESSFEFGELFFNKEAGLEPSTPSSSQDSSSDVSCLESSFEFGELFFNKEAGLEVSKGVKPKEPSTSSSNQDSNSDVPRNERGRLEPFVESEDLFLNKVEVKVKIPDELKSLLVDDLDVIMRQRKLVILPAKVSVDDIVDNYVNYKKFSEAMNITKASAMDELCKGIKEYFNVMLGTQLLYKFEKPQYADILQEHLGTAMSKIYGAVHLLRLCTKFGSMLSSSSLNVQCTQEVLVKIQEFLKYLVENSSTLFGLELYENAPPEYHRKAQGHFS